MDQEPMSRLIRSIHKLAQPSDADRLSDDQLLERFVTGRDQAAFELLLWRHGPMVLGVCRRMLPNPHEAEDAFQAVWLIFVKKAASIAHRGAVGSWLYQVAQRAASRARSRLAKQAAREQHDRTLQQTTNESDTSESRELGRVLDEEVSRLPARQRVAFVLCCIEGRTGEEAARELGCPPGTVSSRLTRARERLRHRLTRRGLAPAVGTLTAALAGEGGTSPVSATLADTTVKAIQLFSVGKPTGGVLSSQAVSLAEGVLRAMVLNKLKIAALVVLTIGVLAGGGVLTHRALTAAPPAQKEQPAQPAKAEVVPAIPKVPKDLLEIRLDAAKKVWMQNLLRIQLGQGLPIELFGWSERWLDAELALNDKKVDRIAALKAHVDRTRELEQLMIRYAKVGQGRESDAASATYGRVSAEIRYFQATGKLPPKAAEAKPRP